ncbi:hypothetical protein [Priestia megaterium]|uniref:hypothetical protein n=1 Tax=Priestia megaterium TaxID=1404 RepID=UPI00338D5EF5
MKPSEKYREYGGVTPQNKEYVEGIIVSPLGARILYDEIQKSLGLTLNIYRFIENGIFVKSQVDLQNRI